MEWRDREGPVNALVIVILFDSEAAAVRLDTDAIASHDRQSLFALSVQEGGLHQFAVFRAEHKDMSDFDSFRRFQDPVFSR